MGRTPEQVAADDALRAAIQGVIEAYNFIGTSSPVILTEYVVITCHRGFEDNGDGNARYNWTVQDEGMPWHHIFGLVEEGKRMMLREQALAHRPEED